MGLSKRTIPEAAHIGRWFLIISLLASPVLAWAEGIPKPPLVWHGIVRDKAGLRVTSGTLSWMVQAPDGGVAVVQSMQLKNLIDQFSYLIEWPCETELGALVASAGALKLKTPAQAYSRAAVTLDGQPLYLANAALGSFTLDAAGRGKIERIDLSLSAVIDSDGDGLPDWWEARFPGGDVKPHDDYDGDGASNWNEYRAGTDPMDPNSFFFILIDIDEATGVPIILWNGVAGRTYQLLRSRNLATGLAGFVEVRRGLVVAPGGANEYRDSEATMPGPYFYLLKVED
jgi:hypothetical protein